MRAGAPAPPGASAETELLWQVRRVRPRTVGRRHSLSLHQASGTGDAPDLGSEHVLVRQLGANRSL